jgi:hypothetical protein
MKATTRENLPKGFLRSYVGLLLRDQKRKVQVNQDIIKHDMQYLRTYGVVAGFVGTKPSEHALRSWLSCLQIQVKGTLILGRSLGRGFFLFKTLQVDVVKELLLLSPLRSSLGSWDCVCFKIGSRISIRMWPDASQHREKERRQDCGSPPGLFYDTSRMSSGEWLRK